MSFWNSLTQPFRGKPKALEGGSMMGSSLWSTFMTNSRPPRKGTEAMLQAYSTHPRLRSVVDRIATSVSSAEWRLYRVPPKGQMGTLSKVRSKGALQRRDVIKDLHEHKDLVPIESHPILDLLANPNPELTARQVIQTIQIHLDLVGESFLIIERNGGGRPAELWPVPPSWVSKLPGKGSTAYKISGGGSIREVPAEDMIWIRNPAPDNPYVRGSGIGGTLNNELDADEHAALTVSTRFFNGAMPEAIISLEGVERPHLEAFQESWNKSHRGFHNTGKPHMTNANLKVERLDTSLVDLDLVNLRKSLGDIVRETYGVPPELVGHLENSNRATISAAEAIYALYVLVPRLDIHEDCLNAKLLPMFETDPNTKGSLVLLYESPVPADETYELEITKLAPYALTINELREEMGKAPLENGDGELHPVPFGISLQGIAATQNRAAALVEPPSKSFQDLKPMDDESEDEDDEDLDVATFTDEYIIKG